MALAEEIHRLQMRGRLANTDVLAKLDLSHTRAAQTKGASVVGAGVVASAAAGIAGLKWFCDRRNRVAESEE